MPLLLGRRAEVKDHWQAAAHAMGGTLPGAASTYRASWVEPAGTAATLWCQQFPDESASRHNGVTVPIVPLIAATPDDSPVYWMGWYEEWGPEAKSTSRRLQFHASSITIYYGIKGTPKRQLFRAEWAGVQKIERQVDIFQGGGAAHPHWHVDAIRGYVDEIGRQIEELSREAELNRELVVDRVRDFGDEKAEKDVAELFGPPTLRLPTGSEMSWTGIHLAANAQWSQQLWPGPEGPHDVHAKGPTDLAALRSWLISCVRYIQAEINKI